MSLDINKVLLNRISHARLRQVYLFYNENVFYSLTANNGQNFVLIKISDDDNKEGIPSWLAAEISETRLSEFEFGLVSAREIFSSGIDILIMLTRQNERFVSLTTISASDIAEDILPEEGTFFKVKDNMFPEQQIPIASFATVAKSSVVDISFGGELLDANVKKIANNLANFEEFALSMASQVSGFAALGSKKTKESLSMAIVQPYAASFGFRLCYQIAKDLDTESLRNEIDQATTKGLEVLNQAKTDLGGLANLTKNQKSSFKKFIRGLSDSKLDLKISHANREMAHFEITFDAKQLKDLYSELDEHEERLKTETLFGTLVGADIKTKTFTFIPHGKKRPIKGTIGSNLLKKEFVLPSEVHVTLQIEIDKNRAFGKESKQYTLQTIKYAGIKTKKT